jgi:hypothetical protein
LDKSPFFLPSALDRFYGPIARAVIEGRGAELIISTDIRGIVVTCYRGNTSSSISFSVGLCLSSLLIIYFKINKDINTAIR